MDFVCDKPSFTSIQQYRFHTGVEHPDLLPEVVLTQFVSPDDEHDVLETCRELNSKNKYIERNLSVTLVIYQESLKYKLSSKSVHWKPSYPVRTDRPTNTTKLVAVFRNFAEVYKKGKVGVMTRRLFGRSGFRISTGIKDFSRLHTVQTVFGAHQASPFNTILGFLPRVKRPKLEVNP